ncbi:MAG: hypothetical protein KGZ74_10330 [Chitinophagaceae bacterium]|nr:hypothetical protein [Chitinophagaceae bacterium]
MLQLIYNDANLTLTLDDGEKGFASSALQQSIGIRWCNIQNQVQFLKGK